MSHPDEVGSQHPPAPYRREHRQWESPNLGRRMELLVFGHSGTRVLMFPTRCGRFYDYERFDVVRTLSEKLSQGWLQLYCVDSIDEESFYCNWCRREDRIRRHLQYERYVLEEVLPVSRDLNPNSHLVAYGCSLGAYHAVNIAMRHPRHFCKVVALSGRYDLTQQNNEFGDLFGGHFDDDIYFNMPTMYLANVGPSEYLNQLRKVEVVLALGEHDPFLPNNQQLGSILADKGIPHQLNVWQRRAHSMKHWRNMTHIYL